MRRETQNIILVLLGGALLKISLTGIYLRYVKPALQPWLIGAGAIIVALALVSIVVDLRRARPAAAARPFALGTAAAEQLSGEGLGEHEHGADAPDDHGHDGHQHGKTRSPWLLLLPVLAIVLIAPPALGADSVNRSGGRNIAGQAHTVKFKPLPPGDAPLLTMSDFATRVVWDDSGTLTGRTIRLSGFVARDRRTGQPTIARLVITCCAADAMPVQARLIPGTGAQDAVGALKPDEWIEVTGQVVPNSGKAADDYVPSFTVTGIAPIPVPQDPYEY